MGLLDNVLGSAVPGGNLAKPVGAALLALLAYKATGGSLGSLLGGATAGAGQQGGAPPQYQPGPGEAGNSQAGNYGGPDYSAVPDQHVPGLIAGGLGGLLQQFQQRGYGDVINSWIGTGQNQPIQPQQLHEALGPETVDNLSRQTGMNQHDLLSQLAQVLPQFVDRLTPQGRLPQQNEVARFT